MGKGSKPRPLSVDRKTFGENWEKIFGKKDNGVGSLIGKASDCDSESCRIVPGSTPQISKMQLKEDIENINIEEE